MRRISWLGAVLLCLVFFIVRVNAQGLTGQISGRVQDPTGSSVPGAKLEVLNTATGQTHEATADPDGNFVFIQLLPGTYQLTVTVPGFKRYTQKDVILTATDRVVVRPVVLELGELSQSMSVSAEVARIQTQSAERSGLINPTQMEGLALKGRDYMDTVRLLPGVVDTANRQAPGFNDLAGVAIHGFRSGAINLTLDGISTLDSGSMTGPYLAPGLDAVGEVKVLLTNYQAEYGRTASGSINVVIKSGSKDFHGSAFYFKRNEALNANEFFNNRNGLRRPQYRYDSPGYTLGGPVLIPGINKSREKLFFFWSQEFLPRSLPSQVGTLTYPTALERQGDFSKSVDTNGVMIPILDPLNNRLSFPGNIIPSNRIDKNGQGLLSVFPLPNTVDPAHTYNNVFQTMIDHPRRDQILRIDWNVDSKTTFYARGILDYEEYKGAYNFSFASSIWPQFPISYLVSSRGFVSTLIHTFNPTLVNEFTFGVNRSLQQVSPQYPGAWDGDNRVKLGLNIPQFYPQNNPYNLLPNAAFGGVQNAPALTEDTRMPFFGRNNIWNYSDNLSKIWGPHNVKLGVYVERATRNASAYTPAFAGNFDFSRNVNNPLDANYAFANALLGSVNSYTEQDARPQVHGRYLQAEWFAQDNWRLHRRFTLDVGVRFYRIGSVYSPGNQLAAFFPDDYRLANAPQLVVPYQATPGGLRQGLNPVTGEILPAVKIGTFALGSGNIYDGMRVFNASIMKTPSIQAAPRLGFAWDVFGNGKTAVRGGFGFFPNRYTNDTVVGSSTNLVSQPPVVNNLTANYTTIKDLLSTPLSLSPSNVTGIETGGKPTTVYNGSFGIQRAIGFGTVLDVAYVGSLGRHMLGAYNLNATPYGTNFLPSSIDYTLAGNLALPANFLRPIKGYGDIMYYGFFESSSYHSMETQVNRRFTRNLTFGLSWTWSKAMDMASTLNPFMDPRMRNYGMSAQDRTHNLVFSYQYTLPRLSARWNNAFSRRVGDDWEVSGITSFISGQPTSISYSFVQSVDITGATGSGVDSRVILTGNPNLPRGERTPLRAFRTEVVRPPVASNFGIGNAPIYPIRGPGTNNWDISVFKNLSFGKEGRFRVQFRAESYNAFNHTQFSGINTAAQFDAAGNQVNGRFGQYISVRDARRIQFALKFHF